MVSPKLNGIFLIDKPAGISSAKAIAMLKKRLQIRKIGHAGTLDPFATGLLVALCGGATRLAQYAEVGRKRYSGEFRFGQTSDSDDNTGEILSQSDILPEFSEVREIVKDFTGEIQQFPPRISAVKIDGKRAYKRARAGEEFELQSRSVHTSSFEVEPTSENGVFRFSLECSKGTYIRSLARDIGEKLGCGGLLQSLRREASYPFDVIDAKDVESLEKSHFVDWRALFQSIPELEVSIEEAADLAIGKEGTLRSVISRNALQLKDAEKAVFVTSLGVSEAPSGLLINDGNRWKFGVNIGV